MSKWRNKIQIYNSYISFYLSQNTFKQIYILSVIFAIYGGLLSRAATDSITGVFNIFSFSTFVLCYYLLIIINTFSLSTFFDNTLSFYNIRRGKKKIILKDKMYIAVIVNLYFNIIVFLLIFSLVYMGHLGSLNITNYANYNINNLIVRTIILSTFISIINVTLYEKIRLKCIYLNLLYFIGILLWPVKSKIHFSINVYNIITLSTFDNMRSDLTSSIACLILLAFFEFVLFKLSYKEEKNEIYYM